MRWQEDLAHEQANLRSITLHKYPGEDRWRCRMAGCMKWVYGRTAKIAMMRAVKAWVCAHRPSWAD